MSRTDHLESRARCPISYRNPSSDTSRENSNTESESEARATHSVDDSSERDSFYFHEESDSAGEMALIEKTFQKQAISPNPLTAAAGTVSGAIATAEDPETSGFSG